MMTTHTLHIKPSQLTLNDLRSVWAEHTVVSLEASAHENINISSQTVADIIAKGDAAYGINTGFGLLAKTRIADEELEKLQRNLILSHSVGTGEPLSDGVVRLVMLMKIASLARGYSGIRAVVIDTMIAMFNAGIIPLIPVKGSVGASGDLAPLSHMTLALLAVGYSADLAIWDIARPADLAYSIGHNACKTVVKAGVVL
ncbi:hypothetical protein GCM10009007_08310 [Formosimonas limnophila]|uniref:Histidine ammonia-lyase n=1 Tax=Formosimonas limnophila TaxID=1384487 RepID=A0A8J3CKM3_9BURK|nr:hypothetical protein GCM10009007_08310 [Formosimonas limnophila]